MNNDIPEGSVLILLFSVYSLANKKVLFCKWVLESETGNISILRKAPYIFWFSNMLISFWLCLFVIKPESLLIPHLELSKKRSGKQLPSKTLFCNLIALDLG